MEFSQRFLKLPFKFHLLIGLLVRMALILYGDYHDLNYDVPYTDVDYKVFTDASRHVLDGKSPYNRHTYRYSPLIVYLMIPNILISNNFGKIIFSFFDLFLTVAVKKLVDYNVSGSGFKNERVSIFSSLFWLYNPLSIAISTRGNADSIPCFLIVLSLMFLQTDLVQSMFKYAISGFFLGLSIHLRLYPIFFSFPMYLSLAKYDIDRKTTLNQGLYKLLPNKNQIILALSCLSSLLILTYSMYLMYGYEFLFETYIYHLVRKDTRHNFSVLFYYLYITNNMMMFDIVKIVTQIFQFLILFALSLTFGSEAKTLPFALFCQAIVLVAYNSVMTSQYFIWFLSLLPLVVHNLKIKATTAFLLTLLWFGSQGLWLFFAFLLEFKSQEVFLEIWLSGVVFFCSNIFVLGRLIKCYTNDYGFGINERLRQKLD